MGYLALFNQHLAKQKKAIEWVFHAHTGDDTVPSSGESALHWALQTDATGLLSDGEGSKTTPMWTVSAMTCEGDCLGRGKGRTKKSAKNEAAKMGLQKMGVEVTKGALLPDD